MVCDGGLSRSQYRLTKALRCSSKCGARRRANPEGWSWLAVQCLVMTRKHVVMYRYGAVQKLNPVARSLVRKSTTKASDQYSYGIGQSRWPLW